jgi:hypothetical protein
MKAYWEKGLKTPLILNLTLDTDDWSDSRPHLVTPSVRAYGIHFIYEAARSLNACIPFSVKETNLV